MKQVIVNETKLSGYTLYSTAPVGAVFSFAGEVVPPGYLECNGQSLSKTNYSKLYAVIGDTYGSTETTFNIPDLRRRFIEGADGNTGEHKEAGLPNITGTFKVYTDGYISQCTGAFDAYNSENNGESYSFSGRSPIYTFDASRSNVIYGKSDTVQPPSICMYYIIKATEYASLETNAIDDTKATTGNVWSASKVNNAFSNTAMRIDAKQNKLVDSGDNQNIKTVNGESILGTGNISTGPGSWQTAGTITHSSSNTTVYISIDPNKNEYCLVAPGGYFVYFPRIVGCTRVIQEIALGGGTTHPTATLESSRIKVTGSGPYTWSYTYTAYQR